MKKLTFAALILNVVAVLFPIAAVVLYFINKDEFSQSYSTLIGFLFIGILTSLVSILMLKLWDKKLRILFIIPTLVNFVCYTFVMMFFNSTTSSSNTVLQLLLIVLYVVGLIFSLSKNAKWASIIVITISSIIVAFSLSFTAALIVSDNVVTLLNCFVGVYYLLTFVSQIVYMVNNLVVTKKLDVIQESSSEEPKEE